LSERGALPPHPPKKHLFPVTRPPRSALNLLFEGRACCVEVRCHMTSSLPETEITLEAVELELARQLQDVVANGFAESVQGAVETAGYRLLLQMPAVGCEDTQRLAAICAGEGDSRRILLVHLEDAGRSLRVKPASNDNAYAKMADSFAEVMEELE